MITKKNEDFNFNFIGSYDVSNINKIVEIFSNEWTLNTSRQSMFDKTHKYTNTYFLRALDSSWQPNQELKCFPIATNIKLLTEVDKIIKDLEEYHDGKCGVAMIVKLFSDNNILPHSDNSPYLSAARRHHIPLKTNKDVIFFVGDEKMHLGVGECWEINNNKIHAVTNHSEEDRIHLMIDIIPNRFIK
jgi:hypothetical protein